MKSGVALIIAALANTALAIPPPVPANDIDLFCSQDLGTADASKHLWTWGPGRMLDHFLQRRGQDNWVAKLEDDLLGNPGGISDVLKCGVLGSQCNTLHGTMTCREHFNKYSEWEDPGLGKNSYYIFLAVEGMAEQFKLIADAFNRETLKAHLHLDSIISDFAAPDDGNIWKWLSTALGISSALGGLVPGPTGEALSTAGGILSSIFGELGDQGDEPPNTADINSALATGLARAHNSLSAALRIATGGFRSEEELNSLPVTYGSGGAYVTRIADFFANGWFLTRINTIAVDELIKGLGRNIERRVIAEAMKATEITIVAEEGGKLHDEGRCNEAGHSWLRLRGDEWRCFHLMRPDGRLGHAEVDRQVYDRLAAYGLSGGALNQFYEASMDCALNGGENKEVDSSTVRWDKVPTCYLSVPVKYVTRTRKSKTCYNWTGCTDEIKNELSDL